MSRHFPPLYQLMVVALACGATLADAQEAAPPRENLPPLPPGRLRGPSDQVAEICTTGRLLRNEGKYEAALAEFDKALKTAQFTKDRAGEAWSLSNKATVYRYRAEKEPDKFAELVKESADFYEQAAAIARESGEKHNEAYATLYLGVLASMRKDPAEAQRRFAAALPLFAAVQDRYYVGRTYACQARAKLQQGEFDPALELFEKSLPCLREVRMFDEVAEVLSEMQAVYAALKRP